MADPGFVAADAVSSVQESVTSLQIDVPEDATAGDRLLLVLVTAPATVASDPTGWTRILDTSSTLTASGGRMLVWTAVAGDEDDVDPGATVTVSLTAPTRAVLGVLVYGPSEIAVEPAVGPVATMPAAPPYTRAAPTATAPDIARVVYVHGINGNESTNDSVSWTPDAATTERIDAASEAPNFRNVTLLVADEVAGPGTVGARTALASARAQAGAATLVLSVAVDRPVATASTPIEAVPAGATGVQLLGDATNGAGPPFTWEWTQTAGPEVELSDPAAQNPTFTAPSEPGVLTFGLVATDSDGVDSLPVYVDVTVLAASGTATPVADLDVPDGWEKEPSNAPTYAALVGDNTDDTYIRYPNPTGTVVVEFGLTHLQQPQAGEPVTMWVRPSILGSSGQVKMILKEGATTVIATSDTFVWDTAMVQEFTYTLPPELIATIEDFTALRMRLEGTVT